MKMETKMEIRVEYLAGTELRKAIIEAKEKAKKWDVAYVKAL